MTDLDFSVEVVGFVALQTQSGYRVNEKCQTVKQ